MRKYLVLVAALVALTMATPPAAASSGIDRIEFMSQNLYIGADLSRVLAGEPPAAVLQTILETNYPARAAEIAQAIDDFNPDLVGLQEVWHISTTGEPGFELDFLEILMAQLAVVDDRYQVAAVVENSNITLPLGDGTFGTVVDRDVILYRNTTTKVDRESVVAENFEAKFTPSLGGIPIPFVRGYVAVDAEVKGHAFRFVNTHLEVEPDPLTGAGFCVAADGTPFVCQDAQAKELIYAISGSRHPVVLVGDLNAEPGTTAYGIVNDAGYTDTWSIRFPYPVESGATCCQDENLQNEKSNLTQRIDHIFIEESIRPLLTITTVVGDWEGRKTNTVPPLWYSDHGGPWARLYLLH